MTTNKSDTRAATEQAAADQVADLKLASPAIAPALAQRIAGLNATPRAGVGGASIDTLGLRKLAEFWAGKYHSAVPEVRAGHGEAWTALIAYIENHYAPAAQALGDAVRDAEHEPDKCWSRDEEDFNARSLGDLLDLHDDLMPGMTVWVGEALTPKLKRLIDAQDVLDTMADRAADIAGEHADDYPAVTDYEKAELETLLAAWITKSCPPNFYEVKNIKPYVLTTDDFADERANAEGKE